MPSASQYLSAGELGEFGAALGVAPCLQRLHRANAAAPGVEQSWGGRVEWMEVFTLGAFTLTPLQRCAAPGLLPEGLSSCAGGCSFSVPLHQVTSWEKWGGLAFSKGTPQLLGEHGDRASPRLSLSLGVLGKGLGG